MNTKHIINSLIVGILLLFSAVTTIFADNIWKMDAKSVTPGSRDTLQLKLENTDEISSFQVDIKLPDGILFTGKPTMSPERSDGHALSTMDLGSNIFRCVAYSLNNKSLKGNKGVLLTIPVLIPNEFTEGTVILSQMVLADKKSQSLQSSTDMGKIGLKVVKKPLTLIVSGLEQIANGTTKKVSYTTIPTGITDFTEKYYALPDTINAVSEAKEEGSYLVKISRTGDAQYLPFTGSYTMLLTSKKEVALTAPEASSIVAGQTLSLSVLSGGSASWKGQTEQESIPVPGSFVWTNPHAKPDAGGNGQFKATFIPSDLMTYSTTEIDVKVKVVPTYIVSVINPSEGGMIKVEGKSANDTYIESQQLTLTAVPEENYEFVGWTDAEGNKANPRTITAAASLTVSAKFERITRSVTFEKPEGGSLNVFRLTDNAKETITSGQKVPQGTLLFVETSPEAQYELSKLEIGGVPYMASQYKLDKDVTVKATFVKITVPKYVVTSSVNEGSGLIRLYNANGASVTTGSSLEKDTKFRVIVLPDPGYNLATLKVLSNGTEVQADNEGLYKVAGETSVASTFTAKTYAAKIAYKYRGESNDSKDLLILSKSEGLKYGDIITVSQKEQKEYALLRIVANGKDIQPGEPIAITGDLTVTGEFSKRVDILPEYLIQATQRYVYNGMSRDFIAYATQTYAFFSFDVNYKKGQASIQDKAVDAGYYNVVITRPEDNLYKAFSTTFDNRLVIDTSRVLVTEQPSLKEDGNWNSRGKTRPSLSDNEIEKEKVNDYLWKISYTPNSEPNKSNYLPADFYVSTSKEKVKLTIGGGLLRGSEPLHGNVRVTNGNMPYTEEQLNNMPKGSMLQLEAVPEDGYVFDKWQDNNIENPRTVSVESNVAYTPVFKSKGVLDGITLQKTSVVYDGTAQKVKLQGISDDALATCRISFYSDIMCEQPAELKNVGTYYVKVYRPEDKVYQELNKTGLEYKITKADVTSEDVTFPVASDVVIGDKLSLSVLSGGAGVVPGIFTWEDATQIVSNETNTFNVVFTPTDPNYNVKTIGVKVKGINTTKGGDVPDPTPIPVPVTGVSLDKTSLTLAVNETAQLIATVSPGNADNKVVSWSSSNESAITVSSTGLVKAIAKGSAVITVTTNDGGKTATCSVNSVPTGIDKVEGLKVYSEVGKIIINSSTPISVKVFDFVGKYYGGYENGIGYKEIAVPKGAYILWSNQEKTKVIVY